MSRDLSITAECEAWISTQASFEPNEKSVHCQMAANSPRFAGNGSQSISFASHENLLHSFFIFDNTALLGFKPGFSAGAPFAASQATRMFEGAELGALDTEGGDTRVDSVIKLYSFSKINNSR